MSGPLPLITLPDFETLVVDRLELCNQAIGGLTVFKQPPVNALPPEAFPICYTLVGPMLQPIPIEAVGAGKITSVNDYIIRVFGAPVGSTLDNSTTAGAQGLVDLLPWFNRFRQYFIGHPKLETTTLGALRYMDGNLLFSHGGTVIHPAPGGADHFAIDITLTIAMYAENSTLS